METDK